MFKLNSIDNIYLILWFVVPGLIAVFMRAQFFTGRSPPHSEAILSYVVLSFIYHALTLLFIDMITEPKDVGFWKMLVVLFLAPTILGAVLGINAQKGFVRGLANKFGMYPVHSMPTAWDWKFSLSKQNWVLVTLKDETKFAGLLGYDSFISSDFNERDIF